MFELHELENQLELEDVNKDILYIKPYYDKLISYFKDSHIISIPFDYEDLIEGKQASIINPSTNVEKYFNVQLKNFNDIRRSYQSKTSLKERLSNNKIKWKVFFFILTRFNTLLIEAIIKEGYVFKDFYIGKLGKVLAKNSKPIVDWSTSFKNKKAIEDAGGIPYYKEGFERAKLNKEEYKGVKWLVHLSAYHYYYKWTLKSAHLGKLPEIKEFSFIPYRGDNSATSRLVEYRNTFTEQELINKYNSELCL